MYVQISYEPPNLGKELMNENGQVSIDFDQCKEYGDDNRPFCYEEYISSNGACANQ
jgi:hypothetical protein